MTDERNVQSQPSQPVEEAPSQPGEPPPPAREEEKVEDGGENEEKGPPYNLWFGWAALGVGLLAYIITIAVFGGKFDAAAATATLGALFTLIGTISGAYFGVKSSSDTADRAKKQVDEANARTERANRSAKAALLEVDPTKSAEFRTRRLL